MRAAPRPSEERGGRSHIAWILILLAGFLVVLTLLLGFSSEQLCAPPPVHPPPSCQEPFHDPLVISLFGGVGLGLLVTGTVGLLARSGARRRRDREQPSAP